MEVAALWTDIRLAYRWRRDRPRRGGRRQAWIRQFAELGHLFPADLKVFAPAELAQARVWIAAD